MKPAIILHGGAGDWNAYNLAEAKKILNEAAEIGLKILKNSGSGLDAVEKSINHLENSGYFDCGLGSFAQNDGKIRMDAGIMEGSSLKCGAVAAIEGIKNPISVARKVMEETNHCLIVSGFAAKFAVRHGFKITKIKPNEPAKTKNISDTVCAIAIGKNGRLFVGNSTGGIKNMIPGRVGDSPMPGAGFYANEFAAAATTGIGEGFIRMGTSRIAVDMAEKGMLPKEIVKKSLNMLKQKTGFEGGIIMLDKNGNHAAHYTTKAMPWVYQSP